MKIKSKNKRVSLTLSPREAYIILIAMGDITPSRLEEKINQVRDYGHLKFIPEKVRKPITTREHKVIDKAYGQIIDALEV